MNDKYKLMVDVSKMYYYFGMNQKEIAEELGVSRGYVCQLMEQARKSGIIEFKIKDVAKEEKEIEYHLRSKFNLQKAIVVPTLPNADPNQLNPEVADTACKYLDTIIESDMVIAFSWGWTIFQVSSNMVKHTDIKNVTSIPLSGGMTNLQKKIYVSEISTNIAEAYNGTPLFIPLPAVLQNAQIKEALYSDTNVSDVLNKSKEADIALFTVGSFGEQNVLYRGGYIDNKSMKTLVKKDAVGDLCAHFINEYGEICDKDLDERTVTINLNDFRKIKNKVCIVTGSQKVKALLGALRKQYVDVLITDESTVNEMLKMI
ncbi:sugar-binding transcriptional regulator [Ruminiclostridium cellulolyticum]|uniref:Transcriptional regulator, DeoR family n=1 Tax=Ruminiclostridium cellulolyticum (strain ATCC 35319 / DSM 5812 / JCM 6584 / H10) TaxID=394503 RepID=B8I9D6_RUMCH|nr:sugar-binding transcriptional regulator [Ruminiclostridium cellulolyticum]ACL75396.1 transcriptional regulator, DeoR family [Ruminiclostridium cellulolyticum H10]